METSHKLLAAAGAAVGVGALMCYLLKEESEVEAEAEALAASAGAAGMAARGPEGGLGAEELLEILKEMVDSQKSTSGRLKLVSKQIAESEDLDFDKVYELVKVAQPVDPLDARGLTMNDLEEPLQRNQTDPQILLALQTLMSGGQDEAALMAAEPSADISVDKITEINNLLVEELDAFMEVHKGLADKSKYDMKTVMIMVQAVLDSKVMRKFGFEATEIQAATMKNQQRLSQSPAFIESHNKMQERMQSFVKMLHALSPNA